MYLSVAEIVVSRKSKFLTEFSKIDNNGLCSVFRGIAFCELYVVFRPNL